MITLILLLLIAAVVIGVVSRRFSAADRRENR
jgi:hypothetical protein